MVAVLPCRATLAAFMQHCAEHRAAVRWLPSLQQTAALAWRRAARRRWPDASGNLGKRVR
jgi:hypothetical protein